jgi:phytoene dehydrogenase-like protein
MESASYFSSTSEDREWDDIVVGSGVGGMTCAAMLARFGHRVLVVEQHSIPGGFTHTFRRHDWRWNVGVHAVGEMGPHSVAGRLMEALTDGALRWARMPSIYDRVFFPDLEIGMADSEEELACELSRAFPRERVRTYLDATRRTLRALVPHQVGLIFPPRGASVATLMLDALARRDWMRTTKDVLATLSNDERYKRVLTSQWGYYGLPPSRSSWTIHASVARHFFYGCFYPVGGAQSIARSLLGYVAARGGWTRVSAPVSQIVGGERARAVRHARGARRHLRDRAHTDALRDLLAAAADAHPGSVSHRLRCRRDGRGRCDRGRGHHRGRDRAMEGGPLSAGARLAEPRTGFVESTACGHHGTGQGEDRREPVTWGRRGFRPSPR